MTASDANSGDTNRRVEAFEHDVTMMQRSHLATHRRQCLGICQDLVDPGHRYKTGRQIDGRSETVAVTSQDASEYESCPSARKRGVPTQKLDHAVGRSNASA